MFSQRNSAFIFVLQLINDKVCNSHSLSCREEYAQVDNGYDSNDMAFLHGLG